VEDLIHVDQLGRAEEGCRAAEVAQGDQVQLRYVVHVLESHLDRVTSCVCQKIAQNVAQSFFAKISA
jgi:hypothetical protein